MMYVKNWQERGITLPDPNSSAAMISPNWHKHESGLVSTPWFLPGLLYMDNHLDLCHVPTGLNEELACRRKLLNFLAFSLYSYLIVCTKQESFPRCISSPYVYFYQVYILCYSRRRLQLEDIKHMFYNQVPT